MTKKQYTWRELNAALKAMDSEKEVLALRNAQQIAGASERWLKRIWHRYSRLRNQRERREGVYRGPRRKENAA